MLQIDEIIISDILNEYYKDFLVQKNKIDNCKAFLEDNLLTDKNIPVSKMINQKIIDEFNDFATNFTKVENWWGRYLDCINELNSGLVSNINASSSDNLAYLEAKNLLNDEME